MSPVAQGPTHSGRALAVAVVGVGLTLGALFLASVALSHRNSEKVGIGDQTFRGSTERFADAIRKRGPILFGDVSGRKERDIIIQHLGTKDGAGWTAFLAAPKDKPRDCTWQWQAKARIFRAKCDRTLTAPAKGPEDTQLDVSVSKGILTVDLNAGQRTTTTSEAPSTSTP